MIHFDPGKIKMTKTIANNKTEKISFVIISLILIVAASLFYYFKAPSTPIEKVRLGIAKESLAALAIIADNQGYFLEQGVDVTVTQYKGGKQALTNGLISGKVDMATTADVPIAVNSFQHQNFKIVSTIGSSDNEPRIIARKDSQISQPQDLLNKKVTTKKGSAVHFFLNVLLSHNGLSEEKINLSFVKSGSEMVDLLVKGKIDAFSHREPFISQAKNLLTDNYVIIEKPGAYTKTYNLVVTNKFLETKTATVEKVLTALLMAEKFSEQAPRKAIKLVSQFIGSSEEAVAVIWKDIDLHISLEQSLVSTLAAEAWWAIDSKLVNEVDIPDYLNILALNPLMNVKPEAIDILNRKK